MSERCVVCWWSWWAVVGGGWRVAGAYCCLRQNPPAYTPPQHTTNRHPLQTNKLDRAPGLPKTRSGKVMRRILRQIALGRYDDLGDTSGLAEPQIVEALVAGAKRRAASSAAGAAPAAAAAR